MSFTHTQKTINASYPRDPNTTLKYGESGLKLVYNKFKTVKDISKDKTRVNLIFAHGTGMNKAIWNYYIRRLYELQNSNWQVDAAISVDAINHGDSAVLNRGKQGFNCAWSQGAKDLIHVVKHEQEHEGDFLINDGSKNILIGHSLGGHQAVMAAFFEPGLFDAVIPIEPVIYALEEHEARFSAILAKMKFLIKDTFNSKADYYKYFNTKSFYQKFNKEVLQEMADDELEIGENDTVHTKSSNIDQMLTYVSAFQSIAQSMSILPVYQTPMLHIIGGSATWNPPDTPEYVKKLVPSQCYDQVIVEGGAHLLVGELPDKVLPVIEDYITMRVSSQEKDRSMRLAVKYNGDRAKALDETLAPALEFLKQQKLAAKNGKSKL